MIGALEVTKILSPASAGAKDLVRRDDMRPPTSPIVPEDAAEFSFCASKRLIKTSGLKILLFLHLLGEASWFDDWTD